MIAATFITFNQNIARLLDSVRVFLKFYPKYSETIDNLNRKREIQIPELSEATTLVDILYSYSIFRHIVISYHKFTNIIKYNDTQIGLNNYKGLLIDFS